MAFASIPPSETWASTTSNTSGTTAAKTQGASLACATAEDPGSARKGQPKAMTPTAVASSTAAHDFAPMRTALLDVVIQSPPGLHGPRRP